MLPQLLAALLEAYDGVLEVLGLAPKATRVGGSGSTNSSLLPQERRQATSLRALQQQISEELCCDLCKVCLLGTIGCRAARIQP